MSEDVLLKEGDVILLEEGDMVNGLIPKCCVYDNHTSWDLINHILNIGQFRGIYKPGKYVVYKVIMERISACDIYSNPYIAPHVYCHYSEDYKVKINFYLNANLHAALRDKKPIAKAYLKYIIEEDNN